MDVNKIAIYVQEGEQLVELGRVAFTTLKGLFTAGSSTDDDAALARLDALYAARIEQAKKDAGR